MLPIHIPGDSMLFLVQYLSCLSGRQCGSHVLCQRPISSRRSHFLKMCAGSVCLIHPVFFVLALCSEWRCKELCIMRGSLLEKRQENASTQTKRNKRRLASLQEVSYSKSVFLYNKLFCQDWNIPSAAHRRK